MKTRIQITAGILVLLVLVLTACTPAAPAPAAPTAAPAAPTAAASGDEWAQIVAKAQAEGTINWAMWGGSEQTNRWVDEFVGKRIKDLYGITLTRTPMDAAEFVKKLMAEKQAGQNGGTIDLLWINGENFTTLKNNDGLFGPYADKLPNAKNYIDFEDPAIAYDFGTPTELMESPYGHAQFTFYYNSKFVQKPPASMAELKDWIKANPGRFTYPMPPDFIGHTFLKQVMYATTGGPAAWQGAFDQAKLESKWGSIWDWLNEVKPNLWRKGETYPESGAKMWELFAQGELWLTMDFSPFAAASNIASGQWPDTVRPVVFTDGTIANNNFVAIPFNSPHPNAAMVVADFLLSPEAQIHKLDPANRGDMMVYAADKLTADDQAKVKAIASKLGPGVPNLDDVLKHALPEPPAQYVPALEKGWTANVLKK